MIAESRPFRASFRLEIDRVAISFHVRRQGTLQFLLDLLARSCVANLAIAGMEARGWEALTGQSGFQPIKGFSVVGLEWSVVVNGNCGVVVRNRDADYEATFDALQA